MAQALGVDAGAREVRLDNRRRASTGHHGQGGGLHGGDFLRHHALILRGAAGAFGHHQGPAEDGFPGRGGQFRHACEKRGCSAGASFHACVGVGGVRAVQGMSPGS